MKTQTQTRTNYILLILLAMFLSDSIFSQKNHQEYNKNDPDYDIGKLFYPNGKMGCINNINIISDYSADGYSGKKCFRIEISGSCPEGSGGTYWTNTLVGGKANKGEFKGSDFTDRRFTKLTFRAKGEKGGEVIEFGTGDIAEALHANGYTHRESYVKRGLSGGRYTTLSNTWVQYTIDLKGVNLSSVIGAFYFSVSTSANPNGVIFYLDDIKFER